MRATLVWSRGFMSLRMRRFKKAQQYIDNQCVEKMTSYVPVGLPRYRNAGKLRDSVKIKSPGVIIYTAPFAKRDYYAVRNHKPPHGGNPKGSRLWFEVMKSKHRSEIIRGVPEITGGRIK